MSVISIVMLTGCGITVPGKAASNKENAESTVNNTKSANENSTESEENNDLEDRLTKGTENYKGFQMDNVLHSDSLGEIHYHIYVPDSYDGSEPYALYMILPVYFVIGENDEYYGSELTKETYEEMREEYEKQGLTGEQIDKLLVLDVKDHAYFTDGGVSVEHGGGILFAQDKNIMGWLFSQEK